MWGLVVAVILIELRFNDGTVIKPGRVWDLVSSGKLRLGDVQFFVLDEVG